MRRCLPRLTDLSSKHKALKTNLQTYIDKAQEALISHKQLEVDIAKVESWLKEADAACAKPVQLDCSLDMLNIQVKKYRVRQTISMANVSTG